MSTSKELMQQYDGYYADGVVEAKRIIAARQTFAHIKDLIGNETFGRYIDVGAGEGSLLKLISDNKLASELHCIEISSSGIDFIKSRNIDNLVSICKFDGYKIDYPDQYFDFGTAVHVVEHVEHERIFLSEMARVCKKFYVEVPLEDFRDLRRSISVSGPFGHINFYNSIRFKNLLETTRGIQSVIADKVFACTAEYEQHLSGKSIGFVKFVVRKKALDWFPKLAERNFVYMYGAVCVSESSPAV